MIDPDHAVGVPMAERLLASRGRGAEPSPQSTSTIPVPVVKSATVAPWLASMKVPSRTVPVVLPSIPVIELPEEPVSVASRTVTPPPGGLVSVVVAPPEVVMMTLRVSGRPGGVSSA